VSNDQPNSIGARVRYWRLRRGLTQQAVAGLTGISRSYLAMIESGERPLDRRSRIAALARALRVTAADLTGDVIPAGDDALSEAHAALPALRLALLGSSLDEPAPVEPRPLAALRAATEEAERLRLAAKHATVMPLLPDLIAELQALAATGSRSEWPEALSLLMQVGRVAAHCAHNLGCHDLGYIVADRVTEAAARAEDAPGAALGAFIRAHALLPIGGYPRALRACERAADELRSHATGAGLEMYGMLGLTAAHVVISAGGDPGDADARIAEAAQVAERLDDTSDTYGAYGLAFSRANVAVWRVASAVERGEGGRAVAIARNLDVSSLPQTRQAAFWADAGRALAQVRRDDDALAALRRAESIAPQQLRTNPMVRDVVASMLRRARNRAGGPELIGFAHRLGIA
jgi:transcriptional regulator with XRE-family HTH domain